MLVGIGIGIIIGIVVTMVSLGCCCANQYNKGRADFKSELLRRLKKADDMLGYEKEVCCQWINDNSTEDQI